MINIFPTCVSRLPVVLSNALLQKVVFYRLQDNHRRNTLIIPHSLAANIILRDEQHDRGRRTSKTYGND